MLEIINFILGPFETNCYLVADTDTNKAAVIDPGWDGKAILSEALGRGWQIGHIWLTHAHFDHFGGASVIADGCNPAIPIALHQADYPLWRANGLASLFGFKIDPGPEPTVDLYDGQIVHLGNIQFIVYHCPGHSPGHVIFHCPKEQVVFCGDVIFNSGIGRTDGPGGDYYGLIKSINEKILTLPDNTRLLCGHGNETTVGDERRWNPFLNDERA